MASAAASLCCVLYVSWEASCAVHGISAYLASLDACSAFVSGVSIIAWVAFIARSSFSTDCASSSAVLASLCSRVPIVGINTHVAYVSSTARYTVSEVREWAGSAVSVLVIIASYACAAGSRRRACLAVSESAGFAGNSSFVPIEAYRASRALGNLVASLAARRSLVALNSSEEVSLLAC